MARLPTPLHQVETRIPEAGRIRLGVKTGNGMKSIDTFRFTSPDQGIIAELAALYGGQAKPWRDAKASPPDQFEVISTAKEINVYLPLGAISCWYELWSGGGITRRCDGETCQLPQTTPGGWEMGEAPCVCAASGRMECRPYTRLNVILPEVSFRGVWRLETKGWNASKELPGMTDVIDRMTAAGQLVVAKLHVERRVQQTPAGKRNFVVPGITLNLTPEQMIAGAADVRALTAGPSPAVAPAGQLGTGVSQSPQPELPDIEDADVMDPAVDALIERLDEIARQHSVDPARFVDGIFGQIKLDRWASPDEALIERVRVLIARIERGELSPIGFNPAGTVAWRTN